MAAAKSPARHTRSAVAKLSAIPQARADAWILKARVISSAVTDAIATTCTGQASHGIPVFGQCGSTTHADAPSMRAKDRSVSSQRARVMAQDSRQVAPADAESRAPSSLPPPAARASVGGGEPGRPPAPSPRRSDGAERSVTFRQATFDGVLRVDDPTLLRDSLVSGIGRAKGYGCGLLTLAPPRSS